MSNFISIIKIGYLNRKPFVNVRNQQKNIKLLYFLLQHGLIRQFNLEGKNIKVWLRYIKNKPLVQNITMISKKGFRKYITFSELNKLNNRSGTNLFILSTPYGYLTNVEALNLKCGGELLLSLTF